MDEQSLTDIEQFAYLYMEKKEIAIITDTEQHLLEDPDSPPGRAFMKGRLKRKAQFHKNITQLSDQLSSPAQAIESKLADKIFHNDKKR